MFTIDLHTLGFTTNSICSHNEKYYVTTSTVFNNVLIISTLLNAWSQVKTNRRGTRQQADLHTMYYM